MPEMFCTYSENRVSLRCVSELSNSTAEKPTRPTAKTTNPNKDLRRLFIILTSNARSAILTRNGATALRILVPHCVSSLSDTCFTNVRVDHRLLQAQKPHTKSSVPRRYQRFLCTTGYKMILGHIATIHEEIFCLRALSTQKYRTLHHRRAPKLMRCKHHTDLLGIPQPCGLQALHRLWSGGSQVCGFAAVLRHIEQLPLRRLRVAAKP